MYNIIIIGARGFGREYYSGFKMQPEYGKEFIIKGFLDDNENALSGFDGYPPILNSVEEYEIQQGDLFLCALGAPVYRKKYIEIIKQKGGIFCTSIHPTSRIHPSAQVGEGVMIAEYVLISANTKIGDFTVIHPFCNIGHDVETGKFCALESYSFLGGLSKVGNNVTLHTRATILPHINVGDKAIVGAGSVVIRNVKPDTTVFGVPAKKVEF